MATLLALLVNAGYFADQPEHDELLVGVVRRLAARPADQGGFALWLRMQRYPALLALYGLGLGCLAARRPGALARAVSTIRIEEAGTDQPIAMGMANYRVLDPQTMKQLPGHQRHLTPISDYLHGRLREAARGILPADDEYDDVFDQLEYLLGVASAYAWGDGTGPVGRFAWRRQYDPNAKADAAVVAHREQLLSVGVFGGSAEALDAAKIAYDEQIAKRHLDW
jgi:hypothetical protein